MGRKRFDSEDQAHENRIQTNRDPESVPAPFPGFEEPKKGWSKLPHSLIEALPTTESMAELKVILYVLRHTWGWQEFDTGKRITLDEFCNGRKRRNGTRLDRGTGLSRNAVRDGLRKAEEHGFLVQEEETDRDRGRRSYRYRLRMAEPRDPNTDPHKVTDRTPDGQKPRCRTLHDAPRTERNTPKENGERDGGIHADNNTIHCSLTGSQLAEIWAPALEHVRGQMPKETFDQWFPGTSLLKLDTRTATVGVANQMAGDTLGRRLHRIVRESLEYVLGYSVDITYEVRGARAGPAPDRS